MAREIGENAIAVGDYAQGWCALPQAKSFNFAEKA